jgi:hypothetical protein
MAYRPPSSNITPVVEQMDDALNDNFLVSPYAILLEVPLSLQTRPPSSSAI